MPPYEGNEELYELAARFVLKSMKNPDHTDIAETAVQNGVSGQDLAAVIESAKVSVMFPDVDTEWEG
jgi:hypothetical protein